MRALRMTASLETFAKVRALYDRTDIPGEKAAAAGRMDALARAAGMTTAEAVSKLDMAQAGDTDWSDLSDLEDILRRTAEANNAPNATAAMARRYGVPIYEPNKVEIWWTVAAHCVEFEWAIPKAHGGKFLTKAERARLKTIAQYGGVTNATADWIEIVLARCEVARKAWSDQEKAGVHPDLRARDKTALSGLGGHGRSCT